MRKSCTALSVDQGQTSGWLKLPGAITWVGLNKQNYVRLESRLPFSARHRAMQRGSGELQGGETRGSFYRNGKKLQPFWELLKYWHIQQGVIWALAVLEPFSLPLIAKPEISRHKEEEAAWVTWWHKVPRKDQENTGCLNYPLPRSVHIFTIRA